MERIQEYQDDLDQEAPYLIPGQDPDQDWPEYGQVSFITPDRNVYKNVISVIYEYEFMNKLERLTLASLSSG